MGGWLMINDEIRAFFSSEVSSTDEEIFGTAPGTHLGQQTWEFLALRIALRVWLTDDESSSGKRLFGKRIQLTFKGDNVGSLTLAVKLRPKIPKMAIIAREIALLLGRLSFPPQSFTHLG